MNGGPSRNRDVVPIRAGSARGPSLVLAVAVVIGIVAFGLLGRLVPSGGPAPVAPPRSTPPASSAVGDGVRLVSPIEGVVWLRATEIAVRGSVPPDVRRIEAALRIDGQVVGETALEVDGLGRFDGIIEFVPPAERTVAILDLRSSGPDRRTLGEVAFPVEAGALLLVRHPTSIAGVGGETLVVDVLVYGPLRGLRGLLTSPSGTLIAGAEKRLGAPDPAAGSMPRTSGLELKLPAGEVLPGRARLHVLGLDADGFEAEHIDANVRLRSGG